MIAVVLGLSMLSFFFFSLSVSQHFKLIHKKRTLGRWLFWMCQLIAWLLLLASVYPAVTTWGIEFGLVNWSLLLHVSALSMVLLINFMPAAYTRLGQWLLIPLMGLADR